tara:strand:+ start:13431 stop:14069 length:639 start_codon:yes stop_codon:yes gene_type:complete
MDNIESKELFNQVRSAHRLLAAYYQRIFQLLTDVTGDERLGLNYYLWEPSGFLRPCQKQTNVFNRSAWDLLPGMNTNYLFHNAKDNNKQQSGEWMLDMCVIADTGTHDNQNLDPLEDALALKILPENANSVLRCYFFTAHKETDLNWYDGLWNAYPYEECSDEKTPKCIDEEQQLYTSSFEVSLDELTGENAKELLVEKIMQFKGALLKAES